MATPQSETTSRRRPVWWVGMGLVLAGLAVLGWVAWQFWGTNWVAHRTQERIVGEVEKKWEADSADVVRVPEGDVAALIHIPKFGDDYAIPVLEGVGDDVLSAGYGHFENAAGPGEKGNYALAAHRITHGEPLRRMPELEVGDEIIVQTRTTTYTYVLTSGGDDLEVSFTAGWVVDALPTNPDDGGVQPEQRKGQRLITMTTCAELFHTDERLVAFGVLEKTEPVSR